MALYEVIKLCIFYWIVRGAQGFQTGNESCNETFSGYQFAISSPKYPETYPRNSKCFYVLKGNQLTRCQPVFYMQFLDFDLEASANCNEDYLKIGGTNVFCGTATGLRKFQAENGELKIVFRSGEREKSRRGFKILVTTSDCTEKARSLDEQNTPQNISSTIASNLTRSSNEGTIERRRKFPPTTTSTTKKPDINFPNNHQNLQLSSYLDSRQPDENYKKFQEKLFSELPDESLLPQKDLQQDLSTQKNLEKSDSAKTFLPIDCETNAKYVSNIDNAGIEPLSRELGPPSVINNGEEVPLILTNPDFLTHSTNPTGIFPNFLTNNEWNQNIPYQNPNWNELTNVQDTPVWHSYPNNYFPPQNNCPNDCNRNPNVYRPPQNYPTYPNIYPLPQNNCPNTCNTNTNVYPQPQNIYPNYWPTNNQNYGNSQCCDSVYYQRRFLIASPGFPNFLYPQNSYDCYYHIQQSSPDICQLRINLKFFNFGLDDPACSYGFVEIDGHKFCGCKTRISVIAPFTNSGGKFLRMHYTGFPKTKASGFLMEVVQESCQFNYGSRLKKEVSEENENKERSKRSLGYHYPKPGGGNIYPSNGWGSCQAGLIYDWMNAAKEIYMGNARCPMRNYYSGRNRRGIEEGQDFNRSSGTAAGVHEKKENDIQK